MANELTDFEKGQLTGRGPCSLHTHETEINHHKHLETLQALEVVVKVTANHTVEYREDIVLADTSAGNITITIPLSRGGKKFYILKTSAANVLTVQFSGAETMLGSASITITALGEGKWLKGIDEGYIPL